MDAFALEEWSLSRHKLTCNVAHSACMEPLLCPFPKPDSTTLSGQDGEAANANFAEKFEDDDARSTSQASLSSSDSKSWIGSMEYFTSSEKLPDFDLEFGITQVVPVNTEAVNLKRRAAAPSTMLPPCIPLQSAFKRTRREPIKKVQALVSSSACYGPLTLTLKNPKTPVTFDCQPSMFFDACICPGNLDPCLMGSSSLAGTGDRIPFIMQKHDDITKAVQLCYSASSGLLNDILAHGGKGKSVLGLKLDVEAVAREINGQKGTG